MPPPTNLLIAQKIWALLTPKEQHSALMLLGLMLIGMLLETLSIGLIIPALTLLSEHDLVHNYPKIQSLLQSLGNPSQKVLIIGGMAILVAVYFIKGVFLAFLAWTQTRFAFGVQAQLSQRLFTVYLRQPYTFHLYHNSAQLIRNIINEVNLFTIKGMLPGMVLLTESLTLVGLSILLLIVEPMGALLVIGVLSAAAWGFHFFTRRRIARWGKARQHHEGLRIQHLQQGLGGVKDVKLLGRETDFLEQYRLHNFQSARMGELQVTLQQLPRLWLELLAVVGLTILVISMMAQERVLKELLPILGLFGAAAFRLIPSVNRVLGAVQSLRYGRPVIDLLHAEIALSTQKTANIHSSVIPFLAALELNQINYTYPGAAEFALKDVSLTIQQGESVGLIGTSGAGKSTLVDILLGLLSPDTGEVRVDSKNIQENLRNWQDQIGYVPQSVFLTDDTLRRNIAFGLSEDQIDDNAISLAIRASQLEELVADLPRGLETLVGERGVRLSGGQRQRIGIARALYHDPSILVLDEATSALDVPTENSVMKSVTALQGIKTIIIIAHRLSTIAHCDRVYRLERGVLVVEDASTDILST